MLVKGQYVSVRVGNATAQVEIVAVMMTYPS